MGYQKAFHDLEDKKTLRLLEREHQRYMREAVLQNLADDILRGDKGSMGPAERLQYELFKMQPKYEKGELRRIIKNFYECLRAFSHGLPNEVYEKFKEAITASLDEKNISSESFLKIVRGEITLPDGTSAKTHPEKFFMPFSKYIEYANSLHAKIPKEKR
jgi:hypothetical protein